ncbi:MAG: DUF3313 family protein [Kiritimatiellia bacterium]
MRGTGDTLRRGLARAAVGACCLCLAGGCEMGQVHSALRTDPAPLSGFLPNHRLLVRQPDSFPFHYFYLQKNLPAYANIYIAPVDVRHLRESDGWAGFDRMLSGRLEGDIEELSRFMRQAYRQAFQQARVRPKLRVVNRRDLPRTLILEAALVALVPSKAELNALGLAGSFVIPGIGLVTSFMSSGSVTVECRIRDGRTGRILAMYANTETDPKALLSISGYTWLTTARINIKTMAAHTASVLAARDYRTVERDFPLRFVSLLQEGELDNKKSNKK